MEPWLGVGMIKNAHSMPHSMIYATWFGINLMILGTWCSSQMWTSLRPDIDKHGWETTCGNLPQLALAGGLVPQINLLI